MRRIFRCLILLPSLLLSQQKVPSPADFFGFQVGEWHLRPDQIAAYAETLAETSDRVTLERYGRTHGGRPLLLLVITAPKNHRAIGTVKTRHRALSDPAQSAHLNLDELPIVVWMGYSVHGNEPSGSNASVLVAHHLAASNDPEIEQILERTIVLIDPMINPDGLSRFAHWANMHRGKNPVADPNHREHNEGWPAGRFNYYWFDLNRDWMPIQHPESRARLAKYYEWMPNVLTDHHEMGTNTTFFFQPGEPTRNNPLAPKRVQELTAAIARFHARALDGIGSLYYTGEGFDDFYIGKGSSYPDVTGSIGILFEQASSRGHVQESAHGPLEFGFTIRNQFTTSLSTLRATHALRKALLNHQREFFASALQEADRSPVKAYVFGSATDPARNYHFLEILRLHQIEVYDLAKATQHEGATFKPGTAFIAPTRQRQFRLLTALFERRTDFPDSLFYDISSWTLPLAFNLPFAEVRTNPQDLLGARIDAPSFPAGKIVTGDTVYAYVLEWNTYYAPRALYRFQKAGILTKVATRAFEAATPEGTRKFQPGSILIPLGLQKEKSDSIRSIVETAVREDGVRFAGLSTGLSTGGIDLGSPNFHVAHMPKTMLAVGPGISATEAGEVWHLLDNRMNMDVSLVEAQGISRIDLSRYTVIVLVNGSYGAVDAEGVASLRRWIERGGTLVATRGAAEWAVNNKLAAATIRKGAQSPVDTATARRAYADELKHSGAVSINGAIVEAIVDLSHPLLFGYEREKLHLFRSGTLFLDPSRNPYASPVVYTQNPLASGYINRAHDKHIAGAASVLVSGLGTGRTILMADNSNFRAFWYGTNRLFLNALFFGHTIRPSSARAGE